MARTAGGGRVKVIINCADGQVSVTVETELDQPVVEAEVVPDPHPLPQDDFHFFAPREAGK